MVVVVVDWELADAADARIPRAIPRVYCDTGGHGGGIVPAV